MSDRIVRGAWYTLVMAFIGGAGIVAVVAGYWGVAEFVAQRWSAGAGAVTAALAVGSAAWLACRFRSDLVYG